MIKAATSQNRNPRILIVTPEITYLPQKMGNMARHLRAKAGGLADVSASLVAALFELGADVHVALPHYRRMFNVDIGKLINDELRVYRSVLPDSRIHLAQDRVFYYREEIYSNYHHDSHKASLAFQREVINNIMPRVNPDLVHCNDWMTGLIPAVARRTNVPCLFTVHNIHTQNVTLDSIEDSGIDAASFWRQLYYCATPGSYEETRNTNPVDCLASGIFAAHFVNAVSPAFLREICMGRHDAFVPSHVKEQLRNKVQSGCALGILNAPDPSFHPMKDSMIHAPYSADDHPQGKRANKVRLQERLGLKKDPSAPMFFWPSRLDPIQKGPQLVTDVLYKIVSSYWEDNLQLVVVANGPYQQAFHDVTRRHDFHERVAICDFDEELSRLGYAASDFTLMPSLFEPCGLPQMIGTIYGSLPLVHDTGGLHDTITPLDMSNGHGNGFIFRTWNAAGLEWAVDQAMTFYRQHEDTKASQLSRIMRQSSETFTHEVTARKYIDLYERMLKRPLVTPF